MNKRIRELAIQSGGHGLRMSTIGLSLLGEDMIEKFAELLLKECIDNVKVWEKDSRNHISYMLKQHFGVEE